MTVTIGWWIWPSLLVVAGVVVAVADYLWDSASGSGDYAALGNGCIGACICFMCWLVAIGLVIGRAIS